MNITTPPYNRPYTLMLAESCALEQASGADIAVFGVPFGDPYSMEEITNDQTKAPHAIRQASQRCVFDYERFDFDLGGTLFDGKSVRFVDCGDVVSSVADLQLHYQNAEKAAEYLSNHCGLVIALGGDHGVTTPILRGFANRGPIVLVHIDAHLDWRDEVNGVREGYSSPIRRASEMAHITGIYQIGLRAQGSASPQEYQAAIAAGAHLYTSDNVRERGMEKILEDIPDGAQYYISIDADGLDPTVMPAVGAPSPGGLSYPEVRKLIQGLVKKGRVVGFDMVEITPTRDLNELTCITAVRLIFNLIGSAVRANYFSNASTDIIKKPFTL